MSHDIKHNIKQQSTWMRGFYMLLFGLFYVVAELVLLAVIVFQFLLKLFTGKVNQDLLSLGQSLSTYIYQILQFENFNSEDHVYPFAPWPKGEPEHRSSNDKELDSLLEKSEQDIDVDGD